MKHHCKLGNALANNLWFMGCSVVVFVVFVIRITKVEVGEHVQLSRFVHSLETPLTEKKVDDLIPTIAAENFIPSSVPRVPKSS